jgi:hypothetical protein
MFQIRNTKLNLWSAVLAFALFGDVFLLIAALHGRGSWG